MAVSPESMPENRTDYPAPPPSPIGTGRRSSVTNDDVLSEFLEKSLRVPDLILPDRIFPRQIPLLDLPSVDFQSIGDADSASRIFESLAGIGCLQLINHGIPPELVRSASESAAGIFGVAPEKKAAAARSPEKPYGFDEIHGGEEDGEMGEEFVWCGDEKLKGDMEGIWPNGYSNFSNKMESLSSEIQSVAGKILTVFRDDPLGRLPIVTSRTHRNNDDSSPSSSPICYVHGHRRNVSPEQWVRSLRYDLIRMLIGGADFSHALCVHVVCDGDCEFHVYSKKGWVSFSPHPNALLITTGDQIQAWSGGKYKHVLGRPIYKGGEEKGCVSMAFLCSPTITITNTHSSCKNEREKTFSLAHQAMLALLSILVYQFFLYIYKKF